MVKTGIVNCPNGFYIGDPCYVLEDKFYQKVVKESYKDNKGQITVDGKTIVAFNTAYGDGMFDGQYTGESYPVDAGWIAVVPLEICEDPKTAGDNGYVDREFKGTIEVLHEDGHFTIKDYETGNIIDVIETDDTYTEDDECWDEDEE